MATAKELQSVAVMAHSMGLEMALHSEVSMEQLSVQLRAL